MSKQPTPKSDQLRAMREAKHTRRLVMPDKATLGDILGDALVRSAASAEKAKAKRAARRKP